MTFMKRDVLRAAAYARVSSEQQAKDNTIASQVEALHRRIAQDGLTLDQELCFIDEGWSGSTLIRPALERLRDQAAAGAIDRLYVHAPTDWPASTPTRSCWLMSCTAAASRSSS